MSKIDTHDPRAQVMFMAYHSEVLQRERDAYRKSSLSPTSPLGKATQEVEGDEILGLRRAGGGGHPLFTAMAEAALAQVGGWSLTSLKCWCCSTQRRKYPGPSVLRLLFPFRHLDASQAFPFVHHPGNLPSFVVAPTRKGVQVLLGCELGV